MSVPDPGEQSAVDHTRAPPAVYTEKTCSVPDRSRVHATAPRFVTETPMIGCWPTAKLGAPVVATSFRLESGHSSRPFASVVRAVVVGLGVVEALAVGVGFAVVRTGAPFVDVVCGDPLGAGLPGRIAGLLSGAVVGLTALVPAGVPEVVLAVAVGFGVVFAVVVGWIFAEMLACAPELAGIGLDPAVVVGRDIVWAAAEDAAESAADEAGAEADWRSEASTPVSDGAADPLV